MWLKKLIAAFIKQNGRKPNAIETLQLKFKAKEKGWTPKVIAGGKSPKKWTDKSGQQWIQDGDGPPVQITEGIGIFDTPYKRMKFDADMKRSLREFTRREDLYEGLPSALRNVKNPEEVKKLLDSGDIKIGTAPKTTKIKDSVDPKFKRAVESQDEQARLIKAFEARNKDSAFNFAFFSSSIPISILKYFPCLTSFASEKLIPFNVCCIAFPCGSRTPFLRVTIISTFIYFFLILTAVGFVNLIGLILDCSCKIPNLRATS